MAQCEKVLAHLMRHGSITPQDAYRRYGIMRLGARIYDLRVKGNRIDTTWEEAPNRYGEKARYARYVYRGREP